MRVGIATTFITIHTTYRCPLSCAHCCFGSGPTVTKRVAIEDIINFIRAYEDSDVRLAIFTGGEPFLLGEELDSAIAEAARLGMESKIVTSAYWAKSKSFAERRLRKLWDLGLRRLSISWDDYHSEQKTFPITVDHVVNAGTAASELGLMVEINLTRKANGYWTADRLRREFGNANDEITIKEAWLNYADRPTHLPQKLGSTEPDRFGPCPFVMTGPTLSGDSTVLACCGVTPGIKALEISDNDELLADRTSNRNYDPLFLWLHSRGPFDLLRSIDPEYSDCTSKASSKFGGNCDACRFLLDERNGYLEQAKALSKSKIAELETELVVKRALERVIS